MTREHKLALIVGFSLVLLVGVLIADHLSLARRAEIAPVGDREISVAQGPSNLMDPLRTIEHQLASQTPASAPQSETRPGVPAVPPLELTRQQPDHPIAEPAPEAAPLHIAQSRYGAPEATGFDGELMDTARQHGWEPRQESGGIVMIQTQQQPPRDSTQSATPAPAPAPRSVQPAPVVESRPAAPIKTHTVEKGDSWFRIAQKHYGDGELWKQLVKFNGGDEVVRLGATVKIPSVETLTGKPAPAKVAAQQPAAPKPEPKKAAPLPAKPSRMEIAALTYTVKRGDTLGEIAQRTLGTSRRWREIADLNKIKDVDVIPAGTVLKLPAMRG